MTKNLRTYCIYLNPKQGFLPTSIMGGTSPEIHAPAQGKRWLSSRFCPRLGAKAEPLIAPVWGSSCKRERTRMETHGVLGRRDHVTCPPPGHLACFPYLPPPQLTFSSSPSGLNLVGPGAATTAFPCTGMGPLITAPEPELPHSR